MPLAASRARGLLVLLHRYPITHGRLLHLLVDLLVLLLRHELIIRRLERRELRPQVLLQSLGEHGLAPALGVETCAAELRT